MRRIIRLMPTITQSYRITNRDQLLDTLTGLRTLRVMDLEPARLPKPGGDDGIWGGLLNDFLLVEHNPDGTHPIAASTQAALSAKVNTDTLVINVKDHGAKGNGIANDLPALQAIINNLGPNGGTLYFPPGQYNIAGSLLLREKVTICGDSSATTFGSGTASSTIHCTNPNVNALDGTDLRTIHIRDIALTGMGQSSGTGGGISLTHTSLATANNCLERVEVSDFGGNGVYINDPITNNLFSVRVERVGGNGIMIVNGTCTFLQTCYVNNSTGAGYYLQSLAYSHLAACAADYNGVGYYLRACLSLNLVGCGCENAAPAGGWNGDQFYLYGGSGVSLINCHTIFNEATSFRIENSALKVVLISPKESSPNPGARYSVSTTAGCDVTVVSPIYVSPTNYTSGTYTELGTTTTILRGNSVTAGAATSTETMMLLKSNVASTNRGATVRLTGESNGDTTYRGAFITYDPLNNFAIFGTHDAADTSASTDIEALKIDRTTGNVSLSGILQLAQNSTGAGTASMGSNSPATTLSAPYTWMKMKAADGTTVYVPAWK